MLLIRRTHGRLVHSLGSDLHVYPCRGKGPPRLFLASLIALIFLRAIAAVPSTPMPIFASLIVATYNFPCKIAYELFLRLGICFQDGLMSGSFMPCEKELAT